MAAERAYGLEQGSGNFPKKQKYEEKISGFPYCEACLTRSPVPLKHSFPGMALGLDPRIISAHCERF